MAIINVTAGGDIQAAIDSANPGDIIQLDAGTYTPSATLQIGKSITIAGAGEGATTITTANSAYGITIGANDVSLAGFSVDAATSTTYGIKADPGLAGGAQTSITGLRIESVTVTGAGRSEIDFNGVDDSAIVNVTADGDGTAGVGIALTDSNNITLTDITTIDNNWGGVGLFSKGQFFPPAGTNNIVFNGSFSSTGQALSVYADETNGDVTNVDLSQFGQVYKVGFTNDDSFTGFFGSQQDAIDFASNSVSPGTAFVTGPEDNVDVDAEPGSSFIVAPNLSIQAAVDAASDGDTIVVGAGSYSEDVVVDKAVTLQGANSGTPGTGMRLAESTLDGSFRIGADVDGVTIDGFRIDGSSTAVGDTFAIYVQGPNTKILNNVLAGDGDFDTAPADRGIVTTIDGKGTGLTVSDNEISGYNTGVYLNPGTEATVSGNTLRGNKVGLSNDGPQSGTSVNTNIFEDNALEQIGIGVTVDNTDLSGFQSGNTFTGASQPVTIYIPASGVTNVIGTEDGDVFKVGANAPVNLSGGAGSDTLEGTTGTDTLDGGAEGDTFQGSFASLDTDILGDFGNGDKITISDTIAGTLKESYDGSVLTLSDDNNSIKINVTDGLSSSGFSVTGNTVTYTTPPTAPPGPSTPPTGGVGGGTAAQGQVLTGTPEADTLTGGEGADTISGLEGNDLLVGNGGDDQIFSGAGDDSAFGGTGNDVIFGGEGNDTTAGGEGDDQLYGGAGNDEQAGGAGNDTIGGGAGNDAGFGGAGNDVLYGGAGADTLYGGSENDTLFGGTEDDLVFGGAGDDELGGGRGNDTLGGGTGADTLYGADGDDVLYGGAGADSVFGGSGNDTVYLGAGDGAQDVYSSTADNGNDVVWGFENGTDLLNLSASGLTTFSDVQSRIGQDADGNATIDLGNGDILTLQGVAQSDLDASDFQF